MAQNPISISVIIPVHNGAQTLEACLKAFRDQSYPADRFEVIVVDNRSNDQTVEIAQRYPVRIEPEREIQSSYAARNTGARCARGEILAFTDADCQPDPDWLARLSVAFIDDSVAAVAGQVISFMGESLVEKFTAAADPLRMQTLGGLLSLITANVAYRRDVFDHLGGFNHRMTTGADVDLGWKVQKLDGRRVVYEEKAIIYHHHRTTLSGLSRQYQRYGFSEIVLDTMYRSSPGYPRTPSHQLGIMGRQVLAMFVYLLSFIGRLFRSLIKPRDRMYLAWPLLWFTAESSNLAGKIKGILATHYFKMNPYTQD